MDLDLDLDRDLKRDLDLDREGEGDGDCVLRGSDEARRRDRLLDLLGEADRLRGDLDLDLDLDGDCERDLERGRDDLLEASGGLLPLSGVSPPTN